MTPHVSIIILNYNGLSDTLECLESLKKCSYASFTIFVADNGSAEKDVDVLSHIQMENYVFTDNTKNLGFAEGNNVIIRKILQEGKSKYIYFLNNDTVVEPDFLTKVVSVAEKDSSIGIVSSLALQYHQRDLVENAGHTFLNCGDFIRRGYNEKKEHYHQACEIFGACGANSLYRVQVLKECGLYDSSFFLMYEDADLSYRCILYGWKCMYEPASLIYHKTHASIKKIRTYDFNVRTLLNGLKTYYYNTPFVVLLLNSPFVLFRDIATNVLNILFFRWEILQVFWGARLLFLKDLKNIHAIRYERLAKRKISSWNILQRQKSFFPFYWNYFVDILIKKKKSSLESR